MPDGSIEAVSALVAFAVVELRGIGVGFSDSKRDFRSTQTQKTYRRLLKQEASQAAAAIRRMNTDLCEMTAQFADARAQHQRSQFAAGALHDDKGRLGREGAAARVAHDVIEEAHGPWHGAVLVVDRAVGVLTIGLADET